MQKSWWILLFTVGCGSEAGSVLDDLPDGEFSDEADLVDWAGSASAPSVYLLAFVPMYTVELSEDESCPAREDDGDRVTYEGDGCTDADGNTYDGRIVVDSGNQQESIRYEDFTIETASDCPDATAPNRVVFNGQLEQVGRSEQAFEIDLVMSGEGLEDFTCVPISPVFAIDYEGVLDGGVLSDTTTWNGSGRVGDSERGVVRATTVDEVLDQEGCATEAMSGTTTLEAGGHEAVITYDGASDCDVESTVTWTYDGEDRGEVSGVLCSAQGAATGGLWLPGIAVALLVRRRR